MGEDMMNMVFSGGKKKCGVLEYTKSLQKALSKRGLSVEIKTLSSVNSNCHLQYEYSLYTFESLNKFVTNIQNNGNICIATLHTYCKRLIRYNVLLKNIPIIIVHSETIAQELRRDGWKNDIRIMPMGVKNCIYEGEICNIRLGSPSIGFFGFMHWYKGLIPLVKAINLLSIKYPRIKCFLFSTISENKGSREYYDTFMEWMSKYEINDRIAMNTEYLPLNKLIYMLSLMDVNILPYEEMDYHSTSAAVRNLMIAKRPIITSDTIYFSDLNEEILKLNQVNNYSIAAAIERVLNDKVLQNNLVEKMKIHMQNNSWEECAEKHIKLYKEVGL